MLLAGRPRDAGVALAAGLLLLLTTLALQALAPAALLAPLLAALATVGVYAARRRTLAPLQQRFGDLEERHDAVLTMTGAQLWTAHDDGSFDASPDGWLHYTGQTAAEAGGDGWKQAIHPDDLPTVEPDWAESVRTGKPYTGEFRVWHAPARSWRWNLERGVRRTEKDGSGRWIGVMIDIDDRRRAEDALRASEERYRALVQQSSEGIWRMAFDPPVPLDLPEEEQARRYLQDGRVVECNDAFARCYGHDTAATMLGVTNGDVLPPNPPRNADLVRELVRSGYVLSCHESLEPAADGSRRVIEATISGIVQGGHLVGEWGIQRDVTAERAAQASVEAQHRLLETILDTVPVGVSVKDATRTYLYANRSAQGRFGWQEGEFRGRRLEDLEDNAHAQRMRDLDDRVFELGVSLRDMPDQMLDRDLGQPRSLLINKSPLFDEDGRVSGVVTCAVDVTELEHARQAARRSERRWRRLFEAAPVPMELFDAKGDWIEGNRASFTVFGEPTTGVRQPNLFDDAGTLAPSCLDQLGRGETWAWEGWYDFDRLTGLGLDTRGRHGRRYLESVVVPLHDAERDGPAYLGICKDETERRLAEQALLESEERYRRFLDQTHEAIWRVEFEPPVPLDLPADERLARYRANGRLAECNDALARHLGCSGTAALMEWLDGDPTAARVEDHAEAFLDGGCRVRDACVTGRRRDGAEVQLRLNAVGEVVDGALVREWCIGQDVTAELAAERRRAEQRALLTAILENVPVGITVKDADARYTYVNRWMCETWGLEPQAVLGRRIAELDLGGEAELASRMDRAVLAGEEAAGEFRNRIRRATDGVELQVLVRKTPIVDAEGRVTGVLSALLDVSALEEANRALEHQRALLQAVLDTAPVSITVKDEQARYQYVNRRAREVSRWGGANVVGRTAAQVDNSAYAQQVLSLDREVLKSGRPRFGVEVGGVDANDGEPLYLRLNKSPLRAPDGSITGIISCTQDVSAEKVAERALEEQRALFESVLDALPIGIGLRDRERRLRYMNRWWRERFGLDGVPAGARSAPPAPADEQHGRLGELDRQVLESGQPVQDVEVPLFFAAGGEPRHGLVSALPLTADDGSVEGILTCTVDITERRRAEEALERSERRYRLLYDDNPSMFFTVDREGVLRQVNRFGAQQLGYEPCELVGRSMLSLHDGEDLEEMERNLRACLQEPARTHRWEVRRLRLDGSALWVRETARAVLGEDGEQLVLTVCEDISEARSLSERLSWQATHDQLTGLVNRREFEHRLALALESARGTGQCHTVAYLDLDQFKVINDSCGHVAGDELLRQLGTLFENRVRRQDTLARLGGDEFGLLMKDCSLDAGERVCEGLRQSLEDYRFAWEGKPFRIGMSAGLVQVDAATAGVADVLSAADAACYAAKDSGRNGIHIYRRDDAELARRRGEMRWVTRLESAMSERRLALACQPILRLNGADAGIHYELLLRMRDVDGVPVSPGEFLPAAERYGLATRLDRYVVIAAAEWLAARPAHVAALYRCGINLSGLTLSAEGFAGFVRRTFDQAGVPLSRVCFEITETAAIANLAHATRFMEELRAEGCSFALDDFGSGLSSFAYLKQLPVEFLKIDGLFVRDMAEDAIDFAMVRSINEIGHIMGMRTIAECVENEAVLSRLREVGVDYAQGRYLAPPAPLEQLE